MRVTDNFLYLIVFLWASVIFIGGWADRYDWRHDHKEIPVYYNSGKIKVVYTVCGDSAKVHANGLHGKLDERMKNLMSSERMELAERSE